ncbi:MAG: PKD domain-containing protein, partial [Planctomycetia bacterium]
MLDVALVEDVLHRNAVLAYGQNTTTVDLGQSVQFNRSIVVDTHRQAADWPGNSLVHLQLIDTDGDASDAEAVEIARGGDGGNAISGALTSEFTVVAFASGVHVEHRLATFASNSQQVDLTLAHAAAADRTFLVQSQSSPADSPDQDERWAARSEIVDNGATLRVRRSETGASTTVALQVVTFDADSGASVKSGTVALNSGNATVAYASQTATNELLFFSYSAGDPNGVEANYRPRGYLENGQAKFATAGTGAGWVTYHVVALPGAVVHRGVETFAGETAENGATPQAGIHFADLAIPGLDPNKAFAYVTASGGASNRSDTLGDTSFAATLSAAGLHLERADRQDVPVVTNGSSLESAAKAAWFVVELPMLNHRPSPVKQSVSTGEATPKTILLAATDEDDDPLTYTIFRGPQHGTVTLQDNVATYTPDPGFVGADEFTFQASDGQLKSNLGVVRVAVVAPALPPPPPVDPFDPPIEPSQNRAPAVLAGPGQVVRAGQTTSFLATASDPNGIADIVGIAWDFAYDGLVFNPDPLASGTLTPNHVYDTPGIYAAAIRVADSVGHVSLDVVEIVVKNAGALIVQAGPDQGAAFGATVSFAGNYSDPSSSVALEDVEWDLDYDGQDFTPTVTGTLTPTFAYFEAGPHFVALKVTDALGKSDISLLTVNVGEQFSAPEADAGLDQAVDQGANASFSGSVNSPSGAIVEVAWDFNYDGETFQTDVAGTL